MKGLLVVSLVVVLVISEKCDHDDDCIFTHCLGSDYTVRCSHDRCTCVSQCAGDDDCDSRSECEHEAIKHNCQCAQGMHCIDKRCHCGFPAVSTFAPITTSGPITDAPTTDITVDNSTASVNMTDTADDDLF